MSEKVVEHGNNVVPARAQSNPVATPGKASNAHALPAGTAQSPQPGLWGPYAAPHGAREHPTGHAIIDEGTGCDGVVNNVCFLTPAQRQRAITMYQGRVNAAETAYLAALVELRVDQLLKKQQRTDVMLELLLDVIGGLAISTSMKAFRLLAKTDAVDEFGTIPALATELSKSTDKVLEGVLKQGLTVGKKMLPKPDATPQADSRRTANLAFIDLLKDRASAEYEYLRENAVAGLGDAFLLVMVEAFRAVNHTVTTYKNALKTKLQRFETSEIDTIGVKYFAGRGADVLGQENETKAFWVNTRTKGRRLALFRRAHERMPTTWFRPGSAIRSTQPAAGQQEQWTRQNDAREWEFVKYVASDMQDVALATHRTKWHSEPEEKHAGVLTQLARGEDVEGEGG